jgi:hypothetical protein
MRIAQIAYIIIARFTYLEKEDKWHPLVVGMVDGFFSWYYRAYAWIRN